MLSNPTLIVAAYYTKFHSALPRELPRTATKTAAGNIV